MTPIDTQGIQMDSLQILLQQEVEDTREHIDFLPNFPIGLTSQKGCVAISGDKDVVRQVITNVIIQLASDLLDDARSYDNQISRDSFEKQRVVNGYITTLLHHEKLV